MKIAVIPTVAATSVMEQAQLIAERAGGELALQIRPFASYDVIVIVGPPNVGFEAACKIRASHKVCYWIVEGILTSLGRRRARKCGCSLSIAPSLAARQWMEESDVHVDYIVPHEIVPPLVMASKNGKAVYIAGNYPRKWMPWALSTLELAREVLDAFYRDEVPDAYAAELNKRLEALGVRRLAKTGKQELYSLMANYGVFASLSSGEGFGLFQREALAMGMNLVTVRHEAFWDILGHPCVHSVNYYDVAYYRGPRDDVYEEYRAWSPQEYVEALHRALERPCGRPLVPKPHYNFLRTLIYELLH